MKRLNKKKAFSHKDQRQDESTTWYFIPDKIILSGCTFVINYRLEDNMIKMEQYKQNIPMELRQYKQWLWFKKIRRVDLKGKKKKAEQKHEPLYTKNSFRKGNL
jgi:possible phage DNA-polymerase or DNA-primase